MILFPSRSGSNYFGQLLSSTGWFNEIAESFSPGQLIRTMNSKGLGDVHETAQWMIDKRGTPHAFGFKAGVAVLTGATEVGLLPEIIERAEVVMLRRRDRVAQAVSLYKGKISGRMHTRQSLKNPITDADYDGDAIDREFRNIPHTEEKLTNFAQGLGKTPPLFYYEDICADPVANVKKVCDMMGLEMPWHYQPKKVRLAVLRDELSVRWCERFRNENPGAE